MLPDANSLSSRAQNRGFCALLAFRTPVFGRFEHKIEVFVRFWASEPLFSGISSTKSRFLCADYHEMAIGKRQTAIGIVVGWWHRGVVTASLASRRMHRVVVAASLTSGRVHQEWCIGKVASGSGGSKFSIGKGASGSGSSKIDIGMRAAGCWLLAVGTGPW